MQRFANWSLAAALPVLVSSGIVGLGLWGPPQPDRIGFPQPDPTAPEEPVAIVLRAQAPNGDETGAIPPVGALLYPGDRLDPPEESRILLLHRHGRLSEVAAPTKLAEAEGETDRVFRLLRALLRSVEEPDAPRSGAPDPAAVAPEPLRPTGERWVRSLTPVLAWRSVSETSQYRVHLWGPDGSVSTLPAGEDTVRTIPPESALSPGMRYEWAVELIPAHRVGPRATFHVAAREVLDELARELSRLRDMGLDPEGDGRLAAAALFRSMALPYDALDALTRLRDTREPWSGQLEAFHRRLVHDLSEPQHLSGEAGSSTQIQDNRFP